MAQRAETWLLFLSLSPAGRGLAHLILLQVPLPIFRHRRRKARKGMLRQICLKTNLRKKEKRRGQQNGCDSKLDNLFVSRNIPSSWDCVFLGSYESSLQLISQPLGKERSLCTCSRGPASQPTGDSGARRAEGIFRHQLASGAFSSCMNTWSFMVTSALSICSFPCVLETRNHPP